ncbi:unnamed protein product, partial [Polarella glacialis]
YIEPLEEGQRIHGWLDLVAGEKSLWQGTLALLEAGKGPWYGPSFGPAPEVVGDIQVKLIPGTTPKALETRIRMADDEEPEWSPPTTFHLQEGVAVAPMAKPNLDNILPMTQNDPGVQEEEKEAGEQKRVKR